MAESPIDVLIRWEEAGAAWRTRSLGADRAVVALCACTGEQVDELCSDDPRLLAYLAARPRSDAAAD
ncbi:MAG: hypothetical protein H0V81_00615 [Solirubrobacterales bacterium]|nr:hypothetical protein [Solirubrobacterales bacterium]